MGFRGQKGQILLIVILAIIVASTVGLSLASRSVTSLRTSTEEAQSQKALSAAEAGIELVMQGTPSTGTINSGDSFSSQSSYHVTVAQPTGSSFEIDDGNTISKDEGVDVWFVNHNSDGSTDQSSYQSYSHLNLYWGSVSETHCNTAAIEVILVTKDTLGSIQTRKYAYDSCLSHNNYFASAGFGTYPLQGTKATFVNKAYVDLTGINNIVLMRVIPIYKDTVMGIDTCDSSGNSCTLSLPSQGYEITSTGTSGQAKHMLTVFRGYQQTYLPYISYGLFVAADK